MNEHVLIKANLFTNMYWLKLTYLFKSEFYKEFTEGLLTVFFITENGKGHSSDLK